MDNSLPVFPNWFLLQIAAEYHLSPQQKDVLLLRLAENRSYQDIAQDLKTSIGACLKRMGAVYQKLGIEGDSRGKENALRKKLSEQYQNQPSSAFSLSLLESVINRQYPKLQESCPNIRSEFVKFAREVEQMKEFSQFQEPKCPVLQQVIFEWALRRFTELLSSAIADAASASTRSPSRLDFLADIVSKTEYLLYSV